MKPIPPTKSPLIFNEYSINTPIGELIIWLDHNNILQFVGWHEFRQETLKQLRRNHQVTDIILNTSETSNTVIEAVKNYFKGDIKTIDNLAVADCGTDFQKKVWQTLRTIPAANTISYGELAKRIGNPLASRAVGMANHCNPIAIVIPCHRVIGKNKTLTGYAAGIERKQWLLNHECYHALLS